MPRVPAATSRSCLALEEGALDFALVEGFFDREKYQSTLLRREEFFGVCAPDHPMAGRQVPLEELMGERLLLREKGSGTRAILEAALLRRHRSLDSFARVTELSDFATIKTLAAHGLGVSFLYAPVVGNVTSTSKITISSYTST